VCFFVFCFALGNDIDDDGALMLWEAVGENGVVSKVNLDRNNISGKRIKEIYARDERKVFELGTDSLAFR